LLVLFVRVPTPFVAPLIASVPVPIVSARAPIERVELPGRFVPARVVRVGLPTRRAKRYGLRATPLVQSVVAMSVTVPALSPRGPALSPFLPALTPLAAGLSTFVEALNDCAEQANQCVKTLVGRVETRVGPVAGQVSRRKRGGGAYHI